MNPILKKYLISSGVTFFTVFFGMIAVQLKSGAISGDNINLAVIIGIFIVASRAGVKAVVEFAIKQFEDKKIEPNV